jgi:hypothetical protein
VKRLGIVAACCMVLGCTDSVDRAARNVYELTLRPPTDGSGYSIRRGASGRVATWQIRIEGSWDAYASWVQPRLLRAFGDVATTPNRGLLFRKALDSDLYTLEIPLPDPPQHGYPFRITRRLGATSRASDRLRT